MPLTQHQLVELNKTLSGQLYVVQHQMVEIHQEHDGLVKAELLMPPRQFRDHCNTLFQKHNHAVRETLMCLTAAMRDLLPRVERIEAFLEEIAEAPLPGKPAVNGSGKKGEPH